MPLILNGGIPLIVNGKLAISLNCCPCSGESPAPCECPEDVYQGCLKVTGHIRITLDGVTAPYDRDEDFELILSPSPPEMPDPCNWQGGPLAYPTSFSGLTLECQWSLGFGMLDCPGVVKTTGNQPTGTYSNLDYTSMAYTGHTVRFEVTNIVVTEVECP